MGLGKIVTKKVISIHPRASAADAAKQMRASHVGDLVVTEVKEGRTVPIGIVTDRDIVMATAALDVSPDKVYVEDIMSCDLVTARVTDSLNHVISQMRKNGVKRIPVLGLHGELEGIVAAEDVLKLLSEELAALSKLPKMQNQAEQSKRANFL